MGERRVMGEGEAESFILALLADGRRRTTQEVEAATSGEGVQCPDSPVKFLMKMQLRGRIEGEMDPKARGWVWWRRDAVG
ncbi:MAG TPA: hypothetical protein VGB42_12165 [Candidatus Thermoplasmatota archaeon]